MVQSSPASQVVTARLVRQSSKPLPIAVRFVAPLLGAMVRAVRAVLAAVAVRRGPVILWGRRGEISLNWRNPLSWPLGLLHLALMPFLAIAWLIRHIARWWR